ncbi:MAG: BRCT domain-containing protein [Sulfurovum sp.]|nr:BRCT domain-containing protein [Sulfurovum sp.]MCB4778490.1 BRCT domain-containing protein [Sulfurovum sp.]
MDKSFEYYDSQRIEDRKIDEFIGLCRGVLADNDFNEEEKKYLIDWIDKNKLTEHNTVGKLYKQLLSEFSLDDLKNTLFMFIGGNSPSQEIASMSTQLPIEKSLAKIEFSNSSFCLTGNFSSAYRNRNVIEEIIVSKNGKCKNSVTMDLDYLVIGEFGNNDWRHSNYGRKIEKAIKYRESNQSKIKIISEKQLLKYL